MRASPYAPPTSISMGILQEFLTVQLHLLGNLQCWYVNINVKKFWLYICTKESLRCCNVSMNRKKLAVLCYCTKEKLRNSFLYSNTFEEILQCFDVHSMYSSWRVLKRVAAVLLKFAML